MSGFVLGINSQLVKIGSYHHLSRIVRNSDSHQHRSNWIMEYDGYDEHGIITPAMVTIVMLLRLYHMFGIG